MLASVQLYVMTHRKLYDSTKGLFRRGRVNEVLCMALGEGLKWVSASVREMA
jgi:hypothetical protein